MGDHYKFNVEYEPLVSGPLIIQAPAKLLKSGSTRNYLSRLGVTSASEVTYNVMKACMTYQTACLYSFVGQREKIGFQSHPLYEVVQACMTIDKKSTQKTFDDIIATFLKNAPSKEGCPKYKVKTWLTFNEPYVSAWIGYGNGAYAPGVYSPDTGVYIAAHNMIKAHAAAWHTYDDIYRPLYEGKVSITLGMDWKEPLTDSAADVLAAERALQFKLGWFAHPIYINGDYPEVMKQWVAAKSEAEGRNESRLPQFTEDEKAFIRGTNDFFGLNHYYTKLVEDRDRGTEWPSWDYDRDVEESFDPSWPETGSFWMREVPWGFRKLLVWIRDQYDNPVVYVNENGVSDDEEHFGKLDDQQRIRYHANYINNVLKAIKSDGCRVAMYTARSLMDDFDWDEGYGTTFGLYQVDFTDPSRKRTAKSSVSFYNRLIADNGWPTFSSP